MRPDPPGPAMELVVLLASAGGLQSLSTVLGHLPATLAAPIVVQQHLAGNDSALPTILRRETAHRVEWAREGQLLVRGQVAVGPPGMYLEIARGGHCRLRGLEKPRERRFDVLLESVAGAYGPNCATVVLSGAGRDGAAGVAAMKRAGAIVIAESPVTARYPSMPVAAATAGADLVLPVYEIGHMLVDIVAGAPLPPAGAMYGPLATCGAPATAEEIVMDSTHRNSRDDLLATRAMENAARRAGNARLRAAELRRRCEDLAAGFGATAQTAATARRAAQDARRRAQLAHQASEEAAARWGR